jgi:Flp pilus assembly protein TadD
VQSELTLSKRPIPTILLLALVVGLLYWNALDGEFVFDDQNLILESGQVQGGVPLTKPYQILFSPAGGVAYRPLRNLSYRLDYALFGLNPKGYHAMNLVYHVLNTSLAFAVARRLSGRYRTALITALLYAVHPIQTEAVAYISGRRDLLSTLFVFLGVLAFLRRRDRGNRGGLGLIATAFVLGLLAKEMAITLPLLLLAYDTIHQVALPPGTPVLPMAAALLRTLPGCFAKDRRLYLPFLILSGVFSVFAVFFSGATGASRRYVGDLDLTLLTSARAIAHYLKLLLFPATLNADYSFDAFPVSRSFFDPAALLAILSVAAILIGLIALLQAEPIAAFGGAWFFLALLPVSQIIPHHELMAEHYLYLPSFGFFLAAAHFADRLLDVKRGATALYGIYACIVLLLSARTVARNPDWHDPLTLWQKTVQTAPRSARVRNNLGVTLLKRGQLEAAERELEEAVRITPNDARRRENLGRLYLRMGRLEAAEAQIEETIRMLPGQPSAHLALGVIYLRQERLKDAEWEFREAARLRPQQAKLPLPEPFLRLAQIGVARQQFDQARQVLRIAVQQKQRGPTGYDSSDEAWRELREALLQQPHNPEAQRLLQEMDQAGPFTKLTGPSRSSE